MTMLFAYDQRLDPLAGKIFWSPLWSTILSALPVLVLFWLLVPRRWIAYKAGAAGTLTAVIIAVFIYEMPFSQACWAFAYGAGFGLLPVGWTIFNAMLLYNITVETGQFTIVRRSVAKLSGDARIQAVLIGFAFGAFMEGAAGAGTPVAICGAILVGLGFNPFLAAVLCLIANTSPVAYGGLGTPLIVLGGVTNIPVETLSIMAGHQLPLMSIVIPAYMVRCMCSWRQTFEIWPLLLAGGGSFALFQFSFATCHSYFPGLVLYHMTDIGGGIFSLVVMALFLRVWRPKKDWHFDAVPSTALPGESADQRPVEEVKPQPHDPHAAAAKEAARLEAGSAFDHVPLTRRTITVAWMPFILMSIFLMLTGIIRQLENRGPAQPGAGPVNIVGPLHTNYQLPVPGLHRETYRDDRLKPPGEAIRQAESALFNFSWLTAPGTAVLLASLVSAIMLRMSRAQLVKVLKRTLRQMKMPVPTIVFMVGLSYVTRYSGMDATLGYAFAGTGALYPFFAAILGWLGVFLTGTDAGSNALFGSLQKITATTIYNNPGNLLANNLDLGQAQVLICTANSTGGVMGKMIDAQSICVATAATHQIGREADLFKAVIWHSIALAVIVGIITLLQAYLYPFTLMVPPP